MTSEDLSCCFSFSELVSFCLGTRSITTNQGSDASFTSLLNGFDPPYLFSYFLQQSIVFFLSFVKSFLPFVCLCTSPCLRLLLSLKSKWNLEISLHNPQKFLHLHLHLYILLSNLRSYNHCLILFYPLLHLFRFFQSLHPWV